MFDSMEERMQQARGGTASRLAATLRAAGLFGLTVILFGGLYLAILLME